MQWMNATFKKFLCLQRLQRSVVLTCSRMISHLAEVCQGFFPVLHRLIYMILHDPYIHGALSHIQLTNRGGSRTAATPKMERFVIIVNGFQPLLIITKRAILAVAAALDPPLVATQLWWQDWFKIRMSKKTHCNVVVLAGLSSLFYVDFNNLWCFVAI